VKSAFQIAVKDLRLRIRDRSALIIGIMAPLVLAFIFNLVFGGAFDTGLSLSYGVADLDQSELSIAFTDVLEEIEADGVFTLEIYTSVSDADSAIDDGEIDAYYFVEQGFGSSIVTGGTPTIEVVGDIDEPTSTEIAASIAQQYSTGVEATQLALATTAALGGTPSRSPVAAAFSYELTDVSAATRQLDPTTYFAAGMAVFFLFFTVQYGVLGLLEEEREGTMARLLAAPIQRSSVVSGKALLAFLLGLISTVILIISTHFLMGATWGAPLGVALLTVAGVLSAVGIMGLVASAAKTPEGAGNLGAIIAVVLGMLGGVFFPIGQGDDLLSKITFLTPHAWFMRGLGDLANDAPWTAALPSVAAIVVFALATGGLAWILLMRRIRR
jgi:ABC-2 type transport system permease protein